MYAPAEYEPLAEYVHDTPPQNISVYGYPNSYYYALS